MLVDVHLPFGVWVGWWGCVCCVCLPFVVVWGCGVVLVVFGGGWGGFVGAWVGGVVLVVFVGEWRWVVI